jgi:hypothetical protein
MSIEDQRRSRAAATGSDAPTADGRARSGDEARDAGARDVEARDAELDQALAEVRKVGIEASQLLRAEGLKPARLVHFPPDARSRPLLGRALSGVRCGHGWHVVRGLVVGTDGQLWARTPGPDATPQQDLGAWRLEVEPPGGPGELPPPVAFDGTSLHTLRPVSEHEYLKVDLIDRLTDGYARLLILHHRQR